MIFALVARKHGDTLITAQAFASLSLFSLLSTPVDQFIQSLPSLASAFACFSTIQLFLAGESRNEYRKFPSTERHIHQSSSSVNSSDEVSEEKVAPTVEVQSVDSEEILSMENCSFRWKEDEEPVLQRISFVIKRSTLNLIIGPVGCGKSSMLNAILGEMPHANGNFRMSSDDIAYCSQSPWLTNGTLQENILGSGLFDRDWYATVVHACVLEQDLKTFDLGDQIQIGSKGLNISGGQKQRLASAFQTPHQMRC
jgi:ATP-binding cassette subfamily C (CFTR/MRP) protein 1